MSARTTAPTHGRSAARVLLAGAMLAGLLAAPAAQAQSPSAAPAPSPAPYPATVAAPDDQQPALAAAWWGWLVGFPSDQDPSTATTCLPSPAGGPVMLPQTYFGTIQQLTCSITADQSVLVAAGGSLCTPDPGESAEVVAQCLADNDASLYDLSIAVDGRLLPDIGAYHALTGPFELQLGADNVFGVDAGPLPAQASATVALLSGFSPGTHTIVVRDVSDDAVLGAQVAESITTLEVR